MTNILSITHALLQQMLAIHWTTKLAMIAMALFMFFLFICVVIFNRIIIRRVRNLSKATSNTNNIMLQALKLSGTNIICYTIAEKMTHNIYGHMVPDEGISDEDWKQRVHPDDRPHALECLHGILDGTEQLSEFNYRWNINPDGPEPQWRYLHNISRAEYKPGISRPVSIISSLADETDIAEEEKKVDELTQKYKLVFEQSIVGLSFYTQDGWLIETNKMMRDICHFDNEEKDAYFSNTNLFDSSPFRENVDKNNVQEFWICSKSDALIERDLHSYLEIRLHPILDDKGKLAYIAISVRDVTEEREMYLQSKLNDAQIQKANEEIQRYEMELRYLMEACDMMAWHTSFADRKIQFMRGLSNVEREMSFDEFWEYIVDHDQENADNFARPEERFTQPVTLLCRMRPLFHDTDEIQWNQLNIVPIYDEQNNLTGSFGLIRNMTRFIQAQEQLKRETERANESNRLKSVFLANMTHEIRTPLNAIVGFSDLLQVVDSPEERREFIRIIRTNCDMLLRLISDILEASDMGQSIALKRESVDLALVFDDICQVLQQRVQDPAVEFLKDNPYSTMPAMIDTGRLQQVLTNFVTNAVKYTKQGHIRVGYRKESRNIDNERQEGICFYCEDTGEGIPKEKQASVFERFVKLNDFVQGTGLGLAICKAIIDKAGGRIGVNSEGEGKGSSFWFWIPA